MNFCRFISLVCFYKGKILIANSLLNATSATSPFIQHVFFLQISFSILHFLYFFHQALSSLLTIISNCSRSSPQFLQVKKIVNWNGFFDCLFVGLEALFHAHVFIFETEIKKFLNFFVRGQVTLMIVLCFCQIENFTEASAVLLVLGFHRQL